VTQRQQQLVIVGARGWHIEEFDELIAELNNANIILPGYIESRDLPALYSGATILIYPSLYEGFGMPVLEAMACGTAVITSDITSMPEVAAAAAELVDPSDIEDIAVAITRVLADSELRQSLVEKGLAVASRYSWEKSANDLLAALKKADL
jgi:glycosyltransferase involved in cell wall biosynthesis